MKMADLRAFVETKLLSKSDKALEKIGHDETKSLDDHVQRQVHNWVCKCVGGEWMGMQLCKCVKGIIVIQLNAFI